MTIHVCVCVFSSHPFWTSSSLDVPAGVTQEEGHTGFLIHLPSAVRALIFVARRIQPFLSLVDREVEFCVLTNSGERARFVGLFKNAQGFGRLDAGSRAGFTSSRPPPSATTRPRVAVPGETNLSTQVTTDTAVVA